MAQVVSSNILRGRNANLYEILSRALSWNATYSFTCKYKFSLFIFFLIRHIIFFQFTRKLKYY